VAGGLLARFAGDSMGVPAHVHDLVFFRFSSHE
jgi:hypothetical protein